MSLRGYLRSMLALYCEGVHVIGMVYEVFWCWCFSGCLLTLFPGFLAPHSLNIFHTLCSYHGPITTYSKDLMILVACEVTSGGDLDH